MTRKILAAIDDMFFAAKVRATAEALGVEIKFYRQAELLVNAALADSANLVIVDLHNQKLDPIAIARELKSKQTTVKLMGFFSHVESELQRAALASGFDIVVPRSVFSRDLAKILAEG